MRKIFIMIRKRECGGGRIQFKGKEYTEYFATEEEAKQFTIKLKNHFLNQ